MSPFGCLRSRNSATEVATPFFAGVRFTGDDFCEAVFGLAMVGLVLGVAYRSGDRFVKLSKKYLICKTCVSDACHVWAINACQAGKRKLSYSGDYANKDSTGNTRWRIERGN